MKDENKSFPVIHSEDDVPETMLEEINNVSTGQVTYAVRDTVIEDKEIKQGDFMGIGDKGILSVGKELDVITVEMVERYAALQATNPKAALSRARGES